MTLRQALMIAGTFLFNYVTIHLTVLDNMIRLERQQTAFDINII